LSHATPSELALLDEVRQLQTRIAELERDRRAAPDGCGSRRQAATQPQTGEDPYKVLFEAMTEGFSLCEIIRDESGKPCDFRYLTVNPAFERHTGLLAADVLGRTALELFPGAEPVWFERYGRVALTGEPARLEEWFGPLGRWFEVRAFRPVPGRFGAVFTDITERKRAEEALAESQANTQRLANALDNVPVYVYMKNRRHEYVFGNQLVLDLFQRTAETLPGCTDSTFFDPETVARLHAIDDRVFEDGETTAEEIDIGAGTPERRVYWEVKLPLRNAQGEIDCLCGVSTDITARKQAESALSESEELYRSLFKHMLNGFAYCRMLFDNGVPQDFIYLAVNDAFEAQTGLKGVTGRKVSEVIPGIREADPKLFEIYGRVAMTGQPEQFEMYVEALRMWFAVSVYGPARECFVAVFDVITERKEAEAALRRSEDQYRELFESSSDALFLVAAATGRIIDANSFASTLYGYAKDELLTKTHADVSAEPEKSAQQAREALTKPDQIIRIPLRLHRKKDGTVFPVEITARSLFRDGQVVLLVCCRDITERKRAEEELRASQESYRQLIEQAEDGVFLASRDGRFIVANPAMRKMLGYTAEEMRQLNILDTYPPAERHLGERRLKAIETGEHVRFDRLIFRKDGSSLPVEASARRLEDGRFQAIVRDATDRKRAEEERAKLEAQLAQAQKMESIGRLAGGVAHDFNNLLTVINGYAAFLQKELAAPDPLREYAREIGKAGERAASLTRQLLAFSRKQIIMPRRIDLNSVVADSERMLRRLIREDIELVTKLAPHLGLVLVDPDQIHQVIMNLAVNARDAMPGGGRLEIATANTELDEAAAALQPDATPGRYVRLTVTDTGTGMTEEVRKNIFEPFFTTKEVGSGTGLGLAMVYGILRQSNGWIDVQSEAGKGSTFRIYLPLVEAGPTDEVKLPAPDALSGEETVLVVEDQEGVRHLAMAILRAHGYHVLEAANGEEAHAVAGQHVGEIDLLLTDVVMPGIDGKALSEQLRESRPNLKVILMSGYSEDVVASQGALDVGLVYIQKPFAPDELAAKVREALAAPGGY
jgi:two-component system, cell cycle sensor histidine kinase and response regulator CckA